MPGSGPVKDSKTILRRDIDRGVELTVARVQEKIAAVVDELATGAGDGRHAAFVDSVIALEKFLRAADYSIERLSEDSESD